MQSEPDTEKMYTGGNQQSHVLDGVVHELFRE